MGGRDGWVDGWMDKSINQLKAIDQCEHGKNNLTKILPNIKSFFNRER